MVWPGHETPVHFILKFFLPPAYYLYPFFFTDRFLGAAHARPSSCPQGPLPESVNSSSSSGEIMNTEEGINGETDGTTTMCKTVMNMLLSIDDRALSSSKNEQINQCFPEQGNMTSVCMYVGYVHIGGV